MKRLTLLLLFTGLVCGVFAQAPHKFNYQAVARDNAGEPLEENSLAIRIEILKDGTAIWQEDHDVVTNAFGHFQLQVGGVDAYNGSGSAGEFEFIDWSSGIYSMKVYVDSGSGFISMGQEELVSVPFALHAANGPKGEPGEKGDQGDPGPEGPQGDPPAHEWNETMLRFQNPDGTWGSETDLKGVKGDPGTGLKNRGEWMTATSYDPGDYVFHRSVGDELVNSMWILEGDAGYTSNTPPYLDPDHWVEFQAPAGPEGPRGAQGDAPAHQWNLTSLAFQNPDGSWGSEVDLKGDKGDKGDQGEPGDPATDDQNLTLDGTFLNISDGTGVDLSPLQDGFMDPDPDPTNELQQLVIADHQLSITNGNTIALPDLVEDADADPFNEIQTLNLVDHTLSLTDGGTVVIPDLVDDADADPGNEIQDLTYSNGIVRLSNDPGNTAVDIDSRIESVSGWELDQDSVMTIMPVTIRTKTDQTNQPLFVVKNDLGNPVFAVYNDGVRVFVDESKKGVKGGFAVGGYNAGKGAITQPYMHISPDSIRFWVNDIPPAKGVKGGFAVGGYNASGKAPSANYLEVTRTNTHVFFDTTDAKGVKGGFAVGGYNASKGVDQLMSLTPENYLIGQDAGTSLTTGFANSFLGYEAGFSTTEGSDNIFLGRQAGFMNLKANENIFIGNQSGNSTVVGYGNVYIGNQTGFWNRDGYFNSFVGYQSGFNNLANHNSFFGYRAGYGNTSGEYNNAFGYQSGYFASTGSNNIYMGNRAGYGLGEGNTGNNNVFIGNQSGFSNSTGSDNVFIGRESGYSNKGAVENIFMGVESGYSTQSGYGNVYIGNQTGYSNLSGHYNSFVGYQSGYSNTSHFNSFFGYQAGFENTSGSYNSFFGYQAGYNNSTGSNNIFLGLRAGYGSPTSGAGITGSYNIFMGDWSGYVTTNGSNNVFLGYNSGRSNTSGTHNIFMGTSSGFANSTGNRNVFIGNESGYNNTTAYDNVFIGNLAGRSNTTGLRNVFIGEKAGYSNQVGSYNTIMGFEAGYSLTGGPGVWEGDYNTVLGYQAGHDMQKAHKNVLIGFQAGYKIRDNRYNVIIGEGAGYNLQGVLGDVFSGQGNLLMGLNAGQALTTGSANIFLGLDVGAVCDPAADNNVWIGLGAGRSSASSGSVFLGYQAGYGENGDDKLVIETGYIGSDNLNNALVYGDFNTNYFRHNGYVGINHSGSSAWGLTIGTDDVVNDWGLVVYGKAYCSASSWSSSDVRLKKNVETYTGALQKITSIRGVSFNWKNDEFPDRGYDAAPQLGVIAQEVEDIIPEIVNDGPDGYKSVDYTKMTAVLIEAIKEQQAQIEALEARIAELEK